MQNTVTIHRLAKREFAKPEKLRLHDDDDLVTGLLPGFTLSLEELFADD